MMDDRALLAIVDGISERLWRVALRIDGSAEIGGFRIDVVRPARGWPNHFGVWQTAINCIDPSFGGGVQAFFVVEADGRVRIYHPAPLTEPGHVTADVLAALIVFDDATDGMVARAMAHEDPVSRATAARIVAAQRARRDAA